MDAGRVEQVLRSVLGGGVGVSVRLDGDAYRYRIVFPDGYAVEGAVGATGRVDVDVGWILLSAGFNLPRSRDLLFVDPYGSVYTAYTYEIMNKPLAMYRKAKDGTPLYMAGKKLYDLRDGSVYVGDSPEVLEKIHRKYRSSGLVKEYIFAYGFTDVVVGGVLWRDDGLMVYPRGIEIIRRSRGGRYAWDAVVFLLGRVYRTIVIDDVVVESALNLTDPRAVAEKYIDAFNKWLERSCSENARLQEEMGRNIFGVYQNYGELKIKPYKLYRGLKELGVEPPEIIRLLSRISVEVAFSRCAEAGVVSLFGVRAYVGMYGDIVRMLRAKLGDVRFVEADMKVVTDAGVELGGRDAFAYIRGHRLEELVGGVEAVVVGGRVLRGRGVLRLLFRMVKVFGLPVRVVAVRGSAPGGGSAPGVLFVFRSGLAVLI